MRPPWCAARGRCAATSRTAPGSAPAGPRSTRSKPWASRPSSACCARRMGPTRTPARSFTWGCWHARHAAPPAPSLGEIVRRRWGADIAAQRRPAALDGSRLAALDDNRPAAIDDSHPAAIHGSRPTAPDGNRPAAIDGASAAATCGNGAAPSHGSRASAKYGVGGAQAQAAAGFPSVYRVALPAYRAGLARSAAQNQARVQAFFALLGHLDDTNLLHRGGREGLAYARVQAARFLAAGGVFQARWQRRATDLHLAFRQRWLSPGGSADLLAVCLFVHAAEG